MNIFMRTSILRRNFLCKKMGFTAVFFLLCFIVSGYIALIKHNSFYVNNPQPLYFQHMAVIVEFRATPFLVTIVLNVIQNIPPDWPVQIFHCKSNAQFIKSSRLSMYIKISKVILTELDDFEGDFNHHINALFTNVSFWNQIPGEKILFFQIDSVMCSNSPHLVTDFLQYDYVGAPWRYQGLRVGNGGFSLRSKNKTITLIENMRSVGMRYSGEVNEDLWYATHFSTVGFVAPSNVAKTFAVESIFYENPLAVHKLIGLDKIHLMKLCAACPDAYLVPPYCNASKY